MEIVRTKQELRCRLAQERRSGREVGFVPTMGYLHDGHLSLMRASVSECDLTVVSIFVNPTQFGPGEDYDRYPRDLQRDCDLAESVDVDYIFAPGVDEMYHPDASSTVTVGGLTTGLCGARRPGHFDGVCTVVSKLFNIVEPDRAYFGQKDAQQVAVIRRMVRDLDIPVEIREMPIIREEDGLAMSSRNVYLTEEERRRALSLNRALGMAEKMIETGELSARVIRAELINSLELAEKDRMDYVSIVDAESLEEIDQLKGDVLIALAVYYGDTRLIDNLKMEVRT